MNGGAWVLLVLAATAAAGDWIAVQRRQRTLEYVCKPLTLVLLMGVAAAVDVDHAGVRNWFLLALGLSLLGDVVLMIPKDWFIPGLAAFLMAHVAFVVGLWVDGVSTLAFVIGLGLVGLAAVVIGGRIIDAVRAGDHPSVAVPVGAYITVIWIMVASATGTEEPFAVGGAALFFCSDALIAWERFVKPRVWHRLAIIVTYHAAQAGLTLSLVT